MTDLHTHQSNECAWHVTSGKRDNLLAEAAIRSQGLKYYTANKKSGSKSAFR